MPAGSPLDEERELRVALMRADIDQKTADIESKKYEQFYKQGLLKYEPWKLAVSAFAAGGIFMGASVAAMTFILSHWR
jgi:RsiW-degrading membrane proteinase PrsW (M82 family)